VEGGRVSATAAPAAPATLDRNALRRVLYHARFRREGVLLESEGYDLLDALGIATPRRVTIADADATAALGEPPLGAARGGAAPERVVLKALGPRLLHKTERGAVAVVANRRAAVAAAVQAMASRLDGEPLAGFMLCEYVPHDAAFGHELLLGLHATRDFGPVVTLAPGGIHSELLGGALRDRQGVAILSPALAREDAAVARALEPLAIARLLTESQRGRAAELDLARLVAAVRAFLEVGRELCPDPIRELEINPLVVSAGRLVALDALATLGHESPPRRAPRPRAAIRRLLEPESIAVVGVSEKLNPGRIILQNVLREGFDRARVFVVKPGAAEIDGCRCVPSLADLPAPVDLAVLSVSAAQSAALVAEIADSGRAGSVVLIPGGLEETPAGAALAARMTAALEASRSRPDGGPVVNGGNCLGIRSVPGRYNTLFIPPHKLPLPAGPADPVALVTGSGAFAVSKLSKLSGVNPLYTITIGNQMDLTAGDFMEFLADDPRVEVFGVYLEGFRPGDGERFLEAARAIVAAGRTVVLYRAGRTTAGAAAAASHTAAIAGDARVARSLCDTAGILTADTLEDFEDLVRLATFLRGREPDGLALGAVSNAGYECVAIADALGPFTLAPLEAGTRAALHAALEKERLNEILTVRNPMDLTPIMGDEGFAAVACAVLEDPGVNAGVVGCVPMTGALDTLAAGAGHGEDVLREDGLAARLIRMNSAVDKPWVAVVDAGRLYDPFARRLEEARIPTFRSADRALRLFGRWAVAAGRGPQARRRHSPVSSTSS